VPGFVRKTGQTVDKVFDLRLIQMNKRYCVRVYESREKDGKTCAGTVVVPVDSFISIYADSGELAEMKLRKEVESGKLSCGRIYQICPNLAVPELIRSVAASLEGSFERVFLDPAAGLYSEARRVRLPDFPRQPQEALLSLAQVLGY
jgi:hypothetical protein